MPMHFCVWMRFLSPAFHGRRDGGQPEWPPSPLRVYQALVAAAAARAPAKTLEPATRAAFEWLERQPAPTLIAPLGARASGYRLSVPNNAMDLVASAWCRGSESKSGDADRATHRTMKTVRPTLLVGDSAVHYVWSLPDPLANEDGSHVSTLSDIARSVVALGWGIDMVVGHAERVSDEQVAALSGERWVPTAGGTGDGLRVPVPGTLDDLGHRHERFLDRLGPDGFTPPPPLSAYSTVEYRRESDPPAWPGAAFSLLKLDASGFQAFDTARRALTVAGMLRSVARLASENAGWTESSVNAFVLGHGEPKSGARHVSVGPQRFAYLPLPSIEARGTGRARVAGSVRRAMLVVFADESDAVIEWARRALSGQELVDEDSEQPVALLSLLPANDTVVRHYTQPAATWSSVTPVVLPGYDDPAHYRRRLKRGTSAEEQTRLLGQLDDRTDGLLRKAIRQAGYSQALADHAGLEWRKIGFWSGSDLADRYGVPDHLRKFARYHVRITWRDVQDEPIDVPGPVCLGAGRFYGVGLFAAP